MLFGLGLLAWFVFSIVNFLISPLTGQNQDYYYFFKPGTSIGQLSSDLSQMGLVRSSFYFQSFAELYHGFHHLRAGEYNFSGQMSPLDVLQKMARGDMLVRKFTLVEGWNFKQVLDALSRSPMLVHHLSHLSDTQISSLLKLNYADPEGLFYPATYDYYYGMSDETLLKRAHQEWLKRLDHFWQLRSPLVPYQNVYQALIVASMIEKETALNAEKPLIASVINNRLQKKMPLQIDAAVIYGLKRQEAGPLSYKDLKIATPYNTYLNHGLPPTPICMPSESSLLAALNPSQSNFLYYVAKKVGEQGHQFSETFDQHVKAVAAYRR